jgi:HK97 family phage major capsid protein
MLVCKSCGKSIKEGVDVCPHCNTKVDGSVITVNVQHSQVTPEPVVAPVVAAPEFDYAKMAEAMQPMVADAAKAAVDAALEDAEPITAKGAPVHMKHAKLGSDNDMSNEIMHYLKTGQMPASRRANLSDWSAKAALQEGSATEGGYLVPDDFYAQVVSKRDEASVGRMSGARVIPTSLKVVNVPVENTAATWAVTAEEGAYNEAEPTFDQVAITVYKHTNLIKLSEELAEDNAANLDGFLSAHLGLTLGKHENDQFLVGSGSSECQGVYVGGTAGLTFDYATTIGPGEIPELMYKLKGEYFDGSVWNMASGTFGYLAGLTGNPFQFQPTPAASGIGMANGNLEGHPVYFSSKNAAKTSGLKCMVFGNWMYYGIAERKGMVIQRNPWLYMANGQIGLFSHTRFGGAVLQAEAFQYGTMA